MLNINIMYLFDYFVQQFSFLFFFLVLFFFFKSIMNSNISIVTQFNLKHSKLNSIKSKFPLSFFFKTYNSFNFSKFLSNLFVSMYI